MRLTPPPGYVKVGEDADTDEPDQIWRVFIPERAEEALDSDGKGAPPLSRVYVHVTGWWHDASAIASNEGKMLCDPAREASSEIIEVGVPLMW